MSEVLNNGVGSEEGITPKTYRLMVNKQDIEVDAKTLCISEARVKRYIQDLRETSFDQTNSYRGFWGDIIMFNILTNKILKTVNPFLLEKILTVQREERTVKGDE